MGTLKTTKKTTISPRLVTEKFSVSIDKFEDAAKKRAKLTAIELINTIEDIPVKYLELVYKEKEYLINIINNEISRINSIKNTKDIDVEVTDADINIWNDLTQLRELFENTSEATINIDFAMYKLQRLEQNVKKTATSSGQIVYIREAKNILNRLKHIGATKGVTAKEIPELFNLAKKDATLTVKLLKESSVSMLKGTSNINLSIESNYSRGLSKLVANMVDKVIDNKFNISGLSKDFDLQHLRFSPNFVEDIENTLTTAILGLKGKTVRRKNISKTEIKKARSAKLKSARDKVKNKKLPRLPTFKDIDKGAVLPLFSIMRLINESLADQLKDNMGESTDPAVLLRNQTGRFAESAKMITLSKTKAGILKGTYTYKRKPYDVFLPGNKLGTKQRNPKIYVEGSIRELAMAIMKRKFPGLALELI